MGLQECYNSYGLSGYQPTWLPSIILYVLKVYWEYNGLDKCQIRGWLHVDEDTLLCAGMSGWLQLGPSTLPYLYHISTPRNVQTIRTISTEQTECQWLEKLACNLIMSNYNMLRRCVNTCEITCQVDNHSILFRMIKPDRWSAQSLQTLQLWHHHEQRWNYITCTSISQTHITHQLLHSVSIVEE